MWLRFDYDFKLGDGNVDNFYAKVFDGVASGVIINDSPFPIDSSESGFVEWNLQGLGPSITILGLEFQLNSSDDLYDSFVTISNVTLEYSVPEPGTLVLLFSGLMGLMGYRKKIH